MELKEFLEQTLVQIVEGVVGAQEKVKQHGGQVVPHFTVPSSDGAKLGLVAAGGNIAQLVQFDVALTTVEGTGSKGGIGVFVGAVNLGSAGQSKSEQTALSHVKFCVPLRLPYDRGA